MDGLGAIMKEALKGLFGSKKFWLTILGSAAVGGLSAAHVPNQIIVIVGSLFGVGVGAQGLADFGKNQPR